MNDQTVASDLCDNNDNELLNKWAAKGWNYTENTYYKDVSYLYILDYLLIKTACCAACVWVICVCIRQITGSWRNENS